MSMPGFPAYASLETSIVFWEAEDVALWFQAMAFDNSVVGEVRRQGVSGMELISLINSGTLENIGLNSKLKRQQMLWNLEKRIKRGDYKAGTAVDPRVFNSNDQGNELPPPPYNVGSPHNNNMQSTKPTNTNTSNNGGSTGDLLLLSFDDEEPASTTPSANILTRSNNTLDNNLLLSNTTNGNNGYSGGNHLAPGGIGTDGRTGSIGELGAIAAVEAAQAAEERERGTAGGGYVYEVTFHDEEPPNILLEEFQPGNRLAVKSFPQKRDGSAGAAERDGRIQKGDFVTAVNGVNLSGFSFGDAIRLLSSNGRPLTLRFLRVPPHLVRHNFATWSMHALRTVLREQGVELTGTERHNDLVAHARRQFWDRPVPLPPASPSMPGGTNAILSGDTSMSGWLLLKGPYDTEAKRRFCDLHGSELLYHNAIGPARDASGGSYEDAPSGAIDMNKVDTVETTRSSEHGQRDLRLVDSEGQVWLISAVSEEAVQLWHKRLLTAQIIGPGCRTSGQPEPSAPTIVMRTSNSITISWMPPRQPHLNTVHSFQVMYKVGVLPIAPWRTASDEVHSTQLLVKGLKDAERHFFRVRAMHETAYGMRWGLWSQTSPPMITERAGQRPRRPPTHLWVLVHGLKGDTGDMAYLGTQLDDRYGIDSYVYLAESNAGPFQTLDGIETGGRRLFDEVLGIVERIATLKKISFICHGLGGLYARVAILMMDNRALLGEHRLTPVNFVTFGTPHLGTLKPSAGVVGNMFESDTAIQLSLRDGSAAMGTLPRVLRLSSSDGVASLGRFIQRTAYANVKFDPLEHYSASIRNSDPYEGVSDHRLAAMVSPTYRHILSLTEAHEESLRQQVQRPFRAQLADQCKDRRIWEDACGTLMSVGWNRVDIYNPSSLSAHKDLVVTTPWLSSEGADIVRHLVDTVLA